MTTLRVLSPYSLNGKYTTKCRESWVNVIAREMGVTSSEALEHSKEDRAERIGFVKGYSGSKDAGIG